MKKLLIIPLLLMAFASYAQLPVIRAPDGVTVEDYRAYFLKNFRLPVFHDTTEANVAKGLDSVGTMIAIRGTDTVYIRRTSTGTIHKWSQLVGSGGGGVTDTIYVTPIGTAAGMIQTLYAVDGNLRVSNWGPGYGTTTHLAGDSLAYIDIDTTSIAYKAWVISLFGTSINNLQQVIDNGHILTRNDTITGVTLANVPQYSLIFDSLFNVTINGSGTGNGFNVYGNGNTAGIQVGGNEVSNFAFGVAGGGYEANLGDSLISYIYNTPDTSKIVVTPEFYRQKTKIGTHGDYSEFANFGSVLYMKSLGFDGSRYGVVAADSTNVAFGQTSGSYQFQFMNQANDTTTYKPVGMTSLGFIKRMDGWAGSGGGGGGGPFATGRDTVQAYASGTTLTQSASTNYIQVNPASVQATLTITTLASGGTWHTSNDLYIVFGGTVTSGNPVITSFTLTAGAGLTKVESVTPSGVVNAGEVIHYHKIGTILYRIN